jgi:hypothetical protein
MKKLLFTTMAGLFFLVAAGVAAAGVNFIPPFAGQHQMVTQSEVYYSGGVGITERQQMQAMTKGCNLKLVFDTKSGDYLSSVAIKILDAKGNVLIHTVSQGPWFSAKLPAATYRVMATFKNHQFTRYVTLGKKPQALILSWTA